MGTTDEAIKYLDRGYYLGFTGYLCKVRMYNNFIMCNLCQKNYTNLFNNAYFDKDKSDTGVRKLLEEGILPLDRLLVETDSPFMYPNTRASKLPQHVKTGITERSLLFLHRYSRSTTYIYIKHIEK